MGGSGGVGNGEAGGQCAGQAAAAGASRARRSVGRSRAAGSKQGSRQAGRRWVRKRCFTSGASSHCSRPRLHSSHSPQDCRGGRSGGRRAAGGQGLGGSSTAGWLAVFAFRAGGLRNKPANAARSWASLQPCKCATRPPAGAHLHHAPHGGAVAHGKALDCRPHLGHYAHNLVACLGGRGGGRRAQGAGGGFVKAGVRGRRRAGRRRAGMGCGGAPPPSARMQAGPSPEPATHPAPPDTAWAPPTRCAC